MTLAEHEDKEHIDAISYTIGMIRGRKSERALIRTKVDGIELPLKGPTIYYEEFEKYVLAVKEVLG